MPSIDKLMIAVDFDGTVVDHVYPEVGSDVPNAVETLKALSKKGCRFILWTMRSGKQLEDAVDWFYSKEIELFGIQINPSQVMWTKSPKAYAHLYIDDAGFGCPLITPKGFKRPCVDWSEVSKQLLGQEVE